MNNLTKEQITLFSAIAAGVLIFSHLALPMVSVWGMGVSMFTMMTSGAPFLGLIFLLLALLAPIYALLYTFKDKEALASLKPIFVLDRKIVYAIPAVLAVIGFIYFIAEGAFSALGFGSWLYLIAAGCLCFLGFQEPKK